jgi:CheY-like chemotaxis protein
MPLVLVVDDSPVDRRLAGGVIAKDPTYRVSYAASGAEALWTIEQELPDIVVTDIQMPDLNGLELVEAIRARNALLPVVLMTAQGSEELAMTALRRGASGYVPKSRLAFDLLATLADVLTVVKAGEHHERLMDCLSQCSFELESDPALLPPLVEFLRGSMTRLAIADETGRLQVALALEAALVNSLYHGSLELTSDQLRDPSMDIASRRMQAPFCDRKIRVQANLSAEEVRFTIEDEGPGFNVAAASAATEAEVAEQIRGLVLMRTFMDDVNFNERGNSVTLIKRRDAASGPANHASQPSSGN